MKFYGGINLHITDAKTGKLLCKFDDKGELITEDEKLVERLKKHFRYEEINIPKRRNKK